MAGKKKKNSHVFNTKKRRQTNPIKASKSSKSPQTFLIPTSEKSTALHHEQNSDVQAVEENVAITYTTVQPVASPCHIEAKLTIETMLVTEADRTTPPTKIEEPMVVGDNDCGSIEATKTINPLDDIGSNASLLSDAVKHDSHCNTPLPTPRTASSEMADDECAPQSEQDIDKSPKTPPERTFKTAVPPTGTVIKFLRSPTLPPALLYANQRLLSHAEPLEDTTPAYARSSHSDWFSNLVSKLAGERLASMYPSECKSKIASRAIPQLAELLNTADAVEGGAKQQQSPDELANGIPSPIVLEPSALVGLNPLDAEGVTATATAASSPSEHTQAAIVPLVSDIGSQVQCVTTVVKTTTSYQAFPLYDADHDLLGATPQSSDKDSCQWFDREPIAPIDADFSDDEDDCEDEMTRKTTSTLSKWSHYDVFGMNLPSAMPETACLTSDSEEASPLVSEGTLQSLDDVDKDSTFLGSVSACDLTEKVYADAEGMISMKELARAWVLCVAAEHDNRRSPKTTIADLWVPFITASDADRALELQLQRRAKLGGVSLKEFLRKFKFDASGMAAASQVANVFCGVALASQGQSKIVLAC
ncbi:hypothetical protein CC86DRAFT_405140 [Ophiobolus disseminans]|uniref:Uncharacterized protein n=1 Tax=Ophiobolus disseminans TaxID=1469910 RepID=A0A6A7A492_9PLEO|nr:hypothetical protein CC86DRAFT_405140 [Ophiobolus disseminans]